MGTLHDAFAKVKEVIDRWHDHVDPDTSLREAQVAFMGEVAKLVHELEDRVKAFTSPVTTAQLVAAPIEVPVAPLIEAPAAVAPALQPAPAEAATDIQAEPAAPSSEATTQSSTEASGTSSAADPADV